MKYELAVQIIIFIGRFHCTFAKYVANRLFTVDRMRCTNCGTQIHVRTNVNCAWLRLRQGPAK